MTPREEFVAEIERIKKAIAKTESPYLKKDYNKALSKMEAELKYYDSMRKVGKV